MTMINKAIVAALACAALSSVAIADELIVTSDSAKGRQMLALDMETQGQAVGIQFKIALPEGVSAKSVDLSKCLADLPSSHSGNCVMLDDQILGLVYSDSNEALPAGMLSIGTVAFRSGKGGEPKVTEFLVSDPNANPLPAQSRVVSGQRPLTDSRENRVK